MSTYSNTFFDLVNGMKNVPQRADFHPEGDTYVHTAIVFTRALDYFNDTNVCPEMFYAAMFHDMGKSDTFAVNPKTGHPTAYGHEHISVRYFEVYAAEVLPDGIDFEFTRFLIQNHMKVKGAINGDMGQGKIDALVAEANSFKYGDSGYTMLQLFHEFDRMLPWFDTATPEDVERAVRVFEEHVSLFTGRLADLSYGFRADVRIGDLYVVRGVSGSGKTTVAEGMAAAIGAPVFSADDYFMVDGEYKFDGTKLGEAHKACKDGVRTFLEASEASDRVCFVANTFTQVWEMLPYFRLAAKFNWRVHSLVVENYHGSKNVHGVPDKSIERMRDRFTVKV